MSAIIAWLMANWSMIAAALLAISEGLHMLFPADSGFGGFIMGVINFLKGLGASQPPSS